MERTISGGVKLMNAKSILFELWKFIAYATIMPVILVAYLIYKFPYMLIDYCCRRNKNE